MTRKFSGRQDYAVCKLEAQWWSDEREPETITLMGIHAKKSGFQFHGRHHEIYLSDARRVPPERLKTILCQPVKKLGEPQPGY